MFGTLLQRALITDLTSQLAASDARVKDLNLKRLFEKSDHEKYANSRVRRLAYRATGQRAKFDAAAEKEEREYLEAMQAHFQETEINRELRAQLDLARAVVGELEPVVAVHEQAQRELDELYEGLFGGVTEGMGREDEVEEETERKAEGYRVARERAEVGRQAVKLLGEARGRMRSADEEMGRALQASKGDILGVFPSAGYDMMERSALARADNQVVSARMLVMQAQRMWPVAGRVWELPEVKIEQGHLMRDIFFDNVMTDYRFHEKIKEGKMSVVRCAQVLDGFEAEARATYQGLEEDRKRKEADLQAARAALQKERERAFEALNRVGQA